MKKAINKQMVRLGLLHENLSQTASGLNLVENRWLSIGEICEHLSFSTYIFKKRIYKSDMPAHRMGLQWKFQKKPKVNEWDK